MKRLAQGCLVVLLLAVVPGTLDARSACSTWRGDVKTLTDPMAMSVNFTPTPTTVEALERMPHPHTLSGHTPRLPQEQHAYRVRARLLEVRQADGEFYVVLQGASGARMHAVIPDPACAAGSAAIIQLRTVRRLWVAQYGQPDTQRFRPVRGQPMLTVYGVLFFNDAHSSLEGTAPNGAELHPVTAIK
jgi:hypothetical protein